MAVPEGLWKERSLERSLERKLLSSSEVKSEMKPIIVAEHIYLLDL